MTMITFGIASNISSCNCIPFIEDLNKYDIIQPTPYLTDLKNSKKEIYLMEVRLA